MRALVTCCLLATFVATVLGGPEQRVFTQRLDHFNPQDLRTWNQYYLANRDNYITGGPVFIYVGSDAYEVYYEYITRGLVYDISAELGGYMFSLEPRFYGQSRPTNDTSVENLQFFSVEQTVADLGHFVQFIKTQYYYTANSNVILFGKGIGASIAVWAKQKYPHLINGVWASSAPLYTSLNFREYMENVGYTFRSIGGQRCYDRIEEAFRRLEQVVARGERLGDIRNEFRLCSEIDHNDPLEVASFFQGLAMVFGTFVENAAYPDIESACLSMVNSQRQGDVEAVAQWMMREYLENIPCLEIGHSDQLRIFSEVRWDTPATTQGRRQEFYRRCTQLSNYPTSDSNNQPFGNSFNTDEFTKSCELLFGPDFNAYYAIQGARRMNTFFGGRNPDIRNVFFTNGEMDPRRTLGVLKDLNEWSPAMVIPLHSRGTDLGSESDEDYPVMRDVKARARELIYQWAMEDDGDGNEVTPTFEKETLVEN